uniref:Uncharacterized protein n=1 Tax=Anguilla anguilla TaxID=7936 RepID=A0A0E9V0H9_ANGAN
MWAIKCMTNKKWKQFRYLLKGYILQNHIYSTHGCEHLVCFIFYAIKRILL